MRAAIIGYGKMGREIFGLLVDSPWEATVLVRDPAKAEEHNGRLAKRLERAARGGLLAKDDLPRRLAGLRFTAAWDDLAGCDLVVETVVEDLAAKVEVLRRTEAVVGPHAVITSNSSSLSMVRLAEELGDPSRFCGYHFFHPIPLTRIVEIITTDRTSPATLEFLRQASRELGRVPLLARRVGSSCVNAVLTFLSCEALYVLEQGLLLPSQIDAVVGQFARVGPCESLDVAGLPLFTQILERMRRIFPLRLEVPELCYKLIREGRLGKYAARGIYLYDHDRPVDDTREFYVNPAQTHSFRVRPGDDVSMYERMLFPIYFAVLSLAEAGLGELAELCLGIEDLIGMRIDPLAEMRSLGSTRLREVFGRLADQLGPRYDAGGLTGVLATLDAEVRG